LFTAVHILAKSFAAREATVPRKDTVSLDEENVMYYGQSSTSMQVPRQVRWARNQTRELSE